MLASQAAEPLRSFATEVEADDRFELLVVPRLDERQKIAVDLAASRRDFIQDVMFDRVAQARAVANDRVPAVAGDGAGIELDPVRRHAFSTTGARNRTVFSVFEAISAIVSRSVPAKSRPLRNAFAPA